MLEVSSSHFNSPHTNDRANMYIHEPEESLGYSKCSRTNGLHENLNIDEYVANQCDEVKKSSANDIPGQIYNRPIRRRFRDVDSIPLFSSTPSGEEKKDNEDHSSAYLQKKARRISRMYLDRATDPFEALEVEPLLLEYLVRHGALSSEASEDILHAEKREQRVLLLTELGLPLSNEAFMRFNDIGSPVSTTLTTSFALLLNALRHTGHHSLASILDCGRRIRPSPGLQSNCVSEHGESYQTRRRGQLCLQIRLDAIKVDPAVYESLLKSRHPSTVPDSHPRDLRGTPLTRPKPATPMLPSFVEDLTTNPEVSTKPPWTCPQNPFWIDQSKPVQPDTETLPQSPPQPRTNTEATPKSSVSEKSVGCFHKLFCLFHPLRKFKTRKRRRSKITEPMPTPVPPPASDTTDMSVTRLRHPLVPMDGAGDCPAPVPVLKPELDELAAAKLALLDTKSSEFCQAVLDPSLPFHDSVVKYFEQSSGVLVLDCFATPSNVSVMEPVINSANGGPILSVTVVATRPDLVTRLVDASKPSQNKSSEVPHAASSDPDGGSKLSTDLQKVLKKVNISSILHVQDFRLSVDLNSSEVAKALEELADLME